MYIENVIQICFFENETEQRQLQTFYSNKKVKRRKKIIKISLKCVLFQMKRNCYQRMILLKSWLYKTQQKVEKMSHEKQKNPTTERKFYTFSQLAISSHFFFFASLFFGLLDIIVFISFVIDVVDDDDDPIKC